MKSKWITITDDIDRNVATRVLDYPNNKRNTTRLNRFCRAASRRVPIYSDYDCTGLVCGVYYSVGKLNDKYIVERVTLFDC